MHCLSGLISYLLEEVLCVQCCNYQVQYPLPSLCIAFFSFLQLPFLVSFFLSFFPFSCSFFFSFLTVLSQIYFPSLFLIFRFPFFFVHFFLWTLSYSLSHIPSVTLICVYWKFKPTSTVCCGCTPIFLLLEYVRLLFLGER